MNRVLITNLRICVISTALSLTSQNESDLRPYHTCRISCHTLAVITTREIPAACLGLSLILDYGPFPDSYHTDALSRHSAAVITNPACVPMCRLLALITDFGCRCRFYH